MRDTCATKRVWNRSTVVLFLLEVMLLFASLYVHPLYHTTPVGKLLPKAAYPIPCPRNAWLYVRG